MIYYTYWQALVPFLVHVFYDMLSQAADVCICFVAYCAGMLLNGVHIMMSS